MKLEVEILLKDDGKSKKCSSVLNIKDLASGEDMVVNLPETKVEVAKSVSERMKEVIESKYESLEELKKMFGE